MIKRIILYSLILLTGSVFLFSSTSYALDISIGATGWYAWWHYHSDDSNQGGDETLDPEPLYGPALAINFSPTWSLTSVFLYGHYDMGGDSGDGPGDMDRYDSDTAINYSFNRYIKAFGGLKFMGYDWDNGDHMGFGPALGIAFTLPLIDNFYLLLNVSGMFLFGKENTDSETGEKAEIDYNEIGVNSNISVAYYIAPASTSIILGFRYQYFEIHYDELQGDMQHAFYGVTLSAIYSLSL
jgi:hypothetical protein